jgi:hypothetical protein
MFMHRPGTADEWSGSLQPEQDYALTGVHPEDPAAGETFVVWLHDRSRNVGVELRLHAKDGTAEGRATIYWPDGRILHATPEQGPLTCAEAPETEHLKYRCLEPYRRWTYKIDGWNLNVTSDAEHDAGTVSPQQSALVSLELAATTLTPVYIQGTLLPEAYEAMCGQAGFWIAGRLTNGLSPTSARYDQALHAIGTITVDGEAMDFDGYGLRGHVRGVREMATFKSHCWMEGVFPESGIAFGVQAHRSSVYGGQGYGFNEAFIWKDGRVYPNRVLYAPPVYRDDPHADFLLELACDELGLTRITGHDTRISWIAMGSNGLGGVTGQPLTNETTMSLGKRTDAASVMSQALTVFDLDGEPGMGFAERSG